MNCSRESQIDFARTRPRSRFFHLAVLSARLGPSSCGIFFGQLATFYGALGVRSPSVSHSAGDSVGPVNRHGQDRLGRLARQRVFCADANSFGGISRQLQRDLCGQYAAALRYNHDLAPGNALVRRHDTDLFPFRLGCFLVHVGKISRSRRHICKAGPRMLKTV